MNGQYDVAQICINGHIINESSKRYPIHNEEFCSKCGEKTITNCPNCSSPIKGSYYIPGIIGTADQISPPSYCHKCGKTYPWMKNKLKAARAFAQELDKLNKKERAILAKSLIQITRDTPTTNVAIIRIKKIMTKIGKETGKSLMKIVAEIATELVKKQLGLN